MRLLSTVVYPRRHDALLDTAAAKAAAVPPRDPRPTRPPSRPEQDRRAWPAWLARPPLWATLLACALILCARRPAELQHPQFWAEDGVIFFGQAWTSGWRSLLSPYAGYLHTAQRLIAWLAVQLDPLRAPAIFHAGAGALTLYVAARTQSSRFPFRPHAGYALAVVLVPDAFEVLLFLVNVQWILAGGLLLLLISRDAKRGWQHAHDSIAAVLMGLTGPFSVLFAPLFIWRAWQRRSRASLLLAALVGLCGAVQGWLLWQAPVHIPPTRIASEHLLAIPGLRVAGSFLLGYRVTPELPLAIQNALGFVTLFGLIALAVRRGPRRLERIWIALAFMVLLAGALYRCRFVLPSLCHAMFGARYFFPLQLAMIWLLLGALGDRRPWLRRTAAALLIWMFAVNLPRLREPGLINCNWPEHAANLGRGEAASVPINPVPWTFSVPARPEKAR